MTPQRWNELMNDNNGTLTSAELLMGWHWCFGGWDGLLVGPGMDEFAVCECSGYSIQRDPDVARVLRKDRELDAEMDRLIARDG